MVGLVLALGAILNRLGHVRGLNAFGSGKIGDGADEFDASRAVKARAESKSNFLIFYFPMFTLPQI